MTNQTEKSEVTIDEDGFYTFKPESYEPAFKIPAQKEAA